MVFMYVVPKAIWEGVEDPVAFDNAEMIRSGPFKLAEYRQGELSGWRPTMTTLGHRPMSMR